MTAPDVISGAACVRALEDGCAHPGPCQVSTPSREPLLAGCDAAETASPRLPAAGPVW